MKGSYTVEEFEDWKIFPLGDVGLPVLYLLSCYSCCQLHTWASHQILYSVRDFS